MELVKLDKSEFDSFYNEIINAFIYDEYREYKEAKKLFFDGSYDIFCLKKQRYVYRIYKHMAFF